ncbi:Protocadherin-23, partial [Lamprotornis superbus]
VKATDADADQFGEIEYSLYDGFNFYKKSKAFQIDPHTGQIFVSQDIDREGDQTTYDLLVKATDGGGLSAQAFVCIEIEDINDNQPVFEQDIYVTSISSHTQPGTEIINVVAIDRDSGIFGIVTYELVPGEFSSFFTVDTTTVKPMSYLRNRRTYQKRQRVNFHGIAQMKWADKKKTSGGLAPLQACSPVRGAGMARQGGGVAMDRARPPVRGAGMARQGGGVAINRIIYLTSAFGHLARSALFLTVSAWDGGGLPSASNAAITVNILQTVVVPAIFERSRYSFSVSEDAPEDSVIGTVKARKPPNSLEVVSYRICSGDPHGKFSIDPQFGIIRTKKELDHEAQSVVVLTVQSQLGNSPIYTSTQVNISVTDINDNPPVFLTKSDKVTISHTQPPGTAIYIAHAEDKDSHLNGAIKYSIASKQSDAFSIDPSLGVVNLTRTVFAEKQKEYTLHIAAEDCGSPPLTSLLMLTVVIEEQKMGPTLVFQSLVYQVEISETTSLGAQILQVQAQSLNSQSVTSNLTYSLEPGTDSVAFGISSDTGWIYLRKHLNYECTQMLSFRALVSTSEDKNLRQNASTSIIVNVLDENDHSPMFMHKSYFFEIEENLIPSGVVGTITAVDKDSGRNGQLSYFLLSDGKYFKINSNTGEIINWAALDREERAHHVLQVLVTDAGRPRRSATAAVRISVRDHNDHAPRFPQGALRRQVGWGTARAARNAAPRRHHAPGTVGRPKSGHCTLPENNSVHVLEGQPSGTLVTTIFAKDFDSGNNSVVSYSVDSVSMTIFEGTELRECLSFGEPHVNKNLANRLNKAEIQKDIFRVYDISSTCLIQVIPLPNGRSGFSQDFKHFVIPENFKPAQVLDSLKAPSNHLALNRKLHFSIAKDDNVHFEIDSLTGELYLSKELDYETDSHFLLQVIIKDYNNPQQNSTVFLSIDVEDKNDNSPYFQEDFVVIGIEENVPVGTLVYTFNAKDGDGSFLNSKIEYSLEMSNRGENQFLIHPLYGTLTTASPLDREITCSVILTVFAEDQAINLTDRRLVSLAVKIVILDINDNSPSFMSSPLSYVMEDVEVGFLAHRVIAKDPDEGRNGQVTYHILSGNENKAFVLDKITGTVTSLLWGFLSCDSHSNIRSVYHAIVKYHISVVLCPGDLLSSGVIALGRAPHKQGSTAHSGLLTTAQFLDREVQECYSLTVIALDDGSPALSATQVLTIIVLDVNDETPVFLKQLYETAVHENRDPGEFVLRVEAVDRDAGNLCPFAYNLLVDQSNLDALRLRWATLKERFLKACTVLAYFREKDGKANIPALYTNGLNSFLQYEILPGPGYEKFKMNSDSGELVTAASLDREAQEVFSIKVLVRDSGTPSLSSTVTVIFTVLDENDHSPTFLLPSSEIFIPENQQLSVVYIIRAVDTDAGHNGTLRYKIIGGNVGEYFTLNNTSGKLLVTRSLDREDISNFTLVIECHDLGSPSRSSTAQLCVTVLDENDHSPLFAETQYQISVTEDLEEGSAILDLSASDKDAGLNGEVMYSLIDDTYGAFAIDSVTGSIITTKALDRETKSQYTFRAVASDHSTYFPRSTTVSIVVHVDDVNDNDPIFLQNPVRVFVPAETAVNETVATVRAEDMDLGSNGAIVFNLMMAEALFQINVKTGDIILRKPLASKDFSTQLLVTASDQGTAPRTATAVVIIFTEEQEEVISFSHSLYEASVPENSAAGGHEILLLGVTISPPFGMTGPGCLPQAAWELGRPGPSETAPSQQQEPGPPPELQAHGGGSREGFINEPLLLLAIESPSLQTGPKRPPEPPPYMRGSSGTITVKEQNYLDYEVRCKIQLRVMAENSFNSVFCGVTVLIQDVNDNGPKFEQSYYKASVWEGQSPKTDIIQPIAVHEQNLRPYTTLKLGTVMMMIYLNMLVVQAADKGNPRLSATSIVRIQVLDVNDNAPVVQPLGEVEVPENALPGFIVTQVSASDADSRPALQFGFIYDNSPEIKFAIDQHTGVIIVVEPLDFEETSVYMLHIIVSDSVHQTEAELTILVLDINDNPPVFTQDCYQVNLPEFIFMDTTVLTLSAIDRDSEHNGMISYKILSSSEGFSIDHKNGSLFATEPVMQLKNISIIHLLIEATDDGSPPLSAVTSIELHVEDVNNCAPRFTKVLYNLSVSEDASVGEGVLLFSAIDCDWTHENTFIEYSIIGSNAKNLFSVETSVMGSETSYKLVGSLVLSSALDREMATSYELVLLASDHGTPSLNSTATVLITVLDVNDSPPVFSSPEYHVHVKESIPIGSHITEVSAKDYDAGTNAEITYAIISGNDRGHFCLDGRTGSVNLMKMLDYEDTMKFTLVIQATDGGTDVKNTAFAVVLVSILDDNDYAPLFLFPSLSCTVSENLPTFSFVCAVCALDFDKGSYGHLTYSIQSSCLAHHEAARDHDMFFIDPLTGDIHTKQMFDYESQNRYCLIIQAKDKGDSLATTRVHVDIEGKDEFDPVFTQEHYFFNLPEKNGAGQLIGRVTASDSDGGLDGVVHYALLRPSPFFSVNQTSGNIYLTQTVHRRENDTLKLLIRAHSPKIMTRFTVCPVFVNVSNSPESDPTVSAHSLTVSVSISLMVFLLLAISLITLALRLKKKDLMNAFVKKNPVSSSAADVNSIREDEDCQKIQITERRILPMDAIAKWLSLAGLREGKNDDVSCRHSDSTGHGSSEGEAAEDEEIKQIYEYPCRKSIGSALSKHDLQMPDSGISGESDQFSYQSRETDVTATMQSMENVQTINRESREEACDTAYAHKILSQTLTEIGIKEEGIMADFTRDYVLVSDWKDSGYDLLATVGTSDQDLRGGYNWDYVLSCEPRFQPLASVFNDIAELKDENVHIHSFCKEKKSLVFPPPLITKDTDNDDHATNDRTKLIVRAEKEKGPHLSAVTTVSDVYE